MIDRQYGKIVFECDACGAAFETTTGDFVEAWAEAKGEGWTSRKIDDVWQHGCPACRTPRVTFDAPVATVETVFTPPVSPPPEQPDENDFSPPPRPGLSPGEYRYIDPRRLRAGLLDRDTPPTHWTADHVASRLIEAHETLQRMPLSTRPKAYGAAWPEYRHEWGELVHQAANGTLDIGRNRIVRGATADEITRMTEALAWPLHHMRDNPVAARDINAWAMRPEETRRPDHLFEMLARRLDAAKVVVR